MPALAVPAEAEASSDWVRLMLEFENERVLAAERGRRASTV